MKVSICPVPSNQIPIKEYEVLTESIFFKWPILGKKQFYKKLFYSWLIASPLIITICSGSYELLNKPPKLFIAALVWSIILPLSLASRQLLSWNYIYKRLRSEKIEYEESGWYDGQTWEKTIEMREKDLLTAQHDIKPILNTLIQSLSITSGLFFSGLIYVHIIL
tara:strand:+ start:376 stop:870 length:495 start_codon:yes stop_codon:yes gene_type:complete